MYCAYYQAEVVKEKTWFLVSTLRSHEHLAFDRTYDKAKGIFEFFVPAELEPYLVAFLKTMKERGIVRSFEKQANRMAPQEKN